MLAVPVKVPQRALHDRHIWPFAQAILEIPQGEGMLIAAADEQGVGRSRRERRLRVLASRLIVAQVHTGPVLPQQRGWQQ